uniref:ATP-dependent RNA helicase n=2 Tax=Proboscia inermis TaxID=420281 RepID=A0A7S0GC94_9STRA|mmetsp:Transcript_19850/g.20152  ORF Transcript_19850/g.20152 Transcript_19850/m.20152 type:complete len:162 (+) Transcript_19850:142-627(+)
MENLTLFRKFNVADGVSTTDNDQSSSAAQPVLVCTDLASRGLDIPGVTAIVQLQFATNVVIHLHRMGRCGRAGKKDGRGIIFYSSKEAGLVDVVREAENQQERMVLEGDVDDTDDKNSDTENVGNAGKVKNAFSRRRGFNKKRKKIRRKEMEATEGVENTM